MQGRPRRSALYMPGSNERALEKPRPFPTRCGRATRSSHRRAKRSNGRAKSSNVRRAPQRQQGRHRGRGAHDRAAAFLHGPAHRGDRRADPRDAERLRVTPSPRRRPALVFRRRLRATVIPACAGMTLGALACALRPSHNRPFVTRGEAWDSIGSASSRACSRPAIYISAIISAPSPSSWRCRPSMIASIASSICTPSPCFRTLTSSPATPAR